MSDNVPGTAASARAARVTDLLAEKELDWLFVSDLTNVRYLTGFTGTNGACLIGRSDATFFTDFRYVERAADEVGDGWERPEAGRELLSKIAERFTGRVGFEDGKLSVRQHEKLAEISPSGSELVPAGDLVERVRSVKEPIELDRIEAAATLADLIYHWTIERGFIGRTELDVSRAVQAHMRELGVEPSFPPIIAAGPNGSQPHAEPGDREIGAGELVTYDMGVELDGYCSDCTRTFATTGDLAPDAAEVYELVRVAQAAASEAVRPGVQGKAVDGVARDLITEGGHGDEFGHGLGHGVGIEVHEGPRLAQSSTDDLVEGNVVTVEPGIYVGGKYGVRIEDLLVVTAEGARSLTHLPKDLTVVS